MTEMEHELRYAAKAGNEETLARLILDGVDVDGANENGTAALLLAAWKRRSTREGFDERRAQNLIVLLSVLITN